MSSCIHYSWAFSFWRKSRGFCCRADRQKCTCVRCESAPADPYRSSRYTDRHLIKNNLNRILRSNFNRVLEKNSKRFFLNLVVTSENYWITLHIEARYNYESFKLRIYRVKISVSMLVTIWSEFHLIEYSVYYLYFPLCKTT